MFLNKFQMENNINNERVELQSRDSAFDRRLHTFAIVNKVPRFDINAFLNEAFPLYKTEMERTIADHNMVKSTTVLAAEFEKYVLGTTNVNEHENKGENKSGSEQVIKETLYFSTPNVLIALDSDLKENFKVNIIDEISKSVEETAIRG